MLEKNKSNETKGTLRIALPRDAQKRYYFKKYSSRRHDVYLTKKTRTTFIYSKRIEKKWTFLLNEKK